MSWFNNHNVQADFFFFFFFSEMNLSHLKLTADLLISRLFPFQPLSGWLWFTVSCHRPSDRATCESNRDFMAAGCRLCWCVCFCGKFTDPVKRETWSLSWLTYTEQKFNCCLVPVSGRKLLVVISRPLRRFCLHCCCVLVCLFDCEHDYTKLLNKFHETLRRGGG